MLYGLENERSIQEVVGDAVDIPEAKNALLRYFDLLPEEEDHDAELGKELLELLTKRPTEVSSMLKLLELNLSSVVMLSKQLTPDAWTLALVSATFRQHRRIIDNRGESLSSGGETDVGKAKEILLRYFDLLPEEEDHDTELNWKLTALMSKSFPDLAAILESLDLDPVAVISLSRQLAMKEEKR